MSRILLDPALYGITPGSAEEAAVHAEILREAIMLSSLHHDRVLSFRGVVNRAGTHHPECILFELASDSLAGYLRKLPRLLSLRECKRLGVDVLCALEYLATRGIVHRDLKPANVLVFTSDREEGVPVVFKVGDVGLARFVEGRGAGDTVALGAQTAVRVVRGRAVALGASMTMTQAGTPLYMAPEVASGHYGVKADMFSFGVMLLEVIATKAIPNTVIHVFSSPYQLSGMCDYVTAHLTAVGQATFGQLLKECIALEAASRPTAQAALARLRDIVILQADDVSACNLLWQSCNSYVFLFVCDALVVDVGLRHGR